LYYPLSLHAALPILAYITIRFIADETCVVRDKDGVILSGDPDRITEMNDIWTFVRDIKDRDPRWLVQETRDGDVIEESSTPLPEDRKSTRLNSSHVK